jgi:peptidoglycan/xylan/chitin deacetylase (PgdA/CDA1 family)
MPLAKRLLNRSKDLLFVPPLDRLWLRAMRGSVTCLLYHRVDEPDSHPFLSRGGVPLMTPAELESDLVFLLDHDARFLSLEDLRLGRLPSATEVGVVVTFDDCFKDNYTHGLGVLDKLGIKGVLFQTTGMLDAQELIWEHALYWLTRDDESARQFELLAHERLADVAGVRNAVGRELVVLLREHAPAARLIELLSQAMEVMDPAGRSQQIAKTIYPSPADVIRASDAGHGIGSHGHRHFKRLNVPGDVFEADLAKSFEVLTGLPGVKPTAFSYPFNSYAVHDDETCSRYFAQVFTSDRARITRHSSPMWLPRYSWYGPAKNQRRKARWLLTGSI